MGGDLTRQYDEFVARGGDTSNLRNGLNSRLMRTTAANIEEGARVMWVHVVSMWCITLYATWLLRRHTRTFALLRQLYLTTAGRDWQILLATSSTRIVNPLFLNEMASCDMSSNICQTHCSPHHVIDMHLASSFVELHGIL